jgi:hypothetical protein
LLAEAESEPTATPAFSWTIEKVVERAWLDGPLELAAVPQAASRALDSRIKGSLLISPL